MTHRFNLVLLVVMLTALALVPFGAAQAQSDEAAQLEKLMVELQAASTAKRHDEVERLAEKGLAIIDRAPPQQKAALANYRIAMAYRLMEAGLQFVVADRALEAERPIKRALAVFEQTKEAKPSAVAGGHAGLAYAYFSAGRDAEVEAPIQRALAILDKAYGLRIPEEETKFVNYPWCWFLLASAYNRLGRYREAEQLHERALEMRIKTVGPNHTTVADSVNNLGLVYLALGQYDKAERCLLIAVQIREAAGDTALHKIDLATSVSNLAVVHVKRGNYAQAELLYKRSLQIYETYNRTSEIGRMLTNLGMVYHMMGQSKQAEDCYSRGLEMAERSTGRDSLAATYPLHNLAELYMEMGQPAKAAPLYQRDLRIVENTLGKEHPSVASNLYGQAGYFAVCERWQEAGSTCDRASRISRRLTANVLPFLAENEQLQFLRNENAHLFHLAQSVGLLRRDDATMATLSAAWVLNGKGVAQEALAERVSNAQAGNDPEKSRLRQELLRVREQQAMLLFAASDKEPAERRTRVAQLTDQEALLSKRLGQATGKSTQANPWVELDAVRGAVPAKGVLIEISRFHVRDFQARSYATLWQPPRYAAWIIPPTGQGPVRLIDLGPADKIEAAVKDVRQGFQEAGDPDAKKNPLRQVGERAAEQALKARLQALAQLVLEPLRPHIGNAERWIISPDADLWLIPWAALPLGTGPDAPYAVEKHRISYVVSGRDLVRTVAKVNTSRPLILADPDFALSPDAARAEAKRLVSQPLPTELRGLSSPSQLPAQFGRLPGTAVEAQTIQPLLARYAGAPPAVYQDKQALEGVVKSVHSPRVMVLSTHGYFLEDQAVDPAGKNGLAGSEKRPVLTSDGQVLESPLLRCGLLLAGASNRQQAQAGDEDGVLTGLEIVGMDLRGTELVVLSACQTGLGQVHNGEGVAGLRQAFQLAGAQSVLATLWQIPDRQTAQLMGGFFTQLAEQQGKADALREAQLALLKQRRQAFGAAHPFYWAAFTLTGQ